MGKYKGIIFDLDGTTLDTIQDLSDSVNEVLKQFGHPTHGYEEYKLKIGHGFRNLLEVSFPKDSWDRNRIDEALELFVKIYDKKYMEKTMPYEGICQLLLELNRRNIKIAVNSNKRHDYTNALIKKNFPDIPFVDVIGEQAGVPKKPDPKAALKIAEKMELLPTEILYAGDSETDMQTGKNANMDTVGVLWGFRSREELEENGATYLAESTEDILKLF